MAAKVSFYKINANRLASLPIKEGQIIVTQDTGVLYIDTTNSNRARIGDINTTYSLSQDANNGHILTFTPSVGEPTTITIPDDNDNTTYSLTQNTSNRSQITLTPSIGQAQTITLPNDNTTYTLTQDANDEHKIIFTSSDGATTTITIPDNDTTYSKATANADGLMSKEHYEKLEGIAAGANKVTVDSSLSSTSTNPVQNKVINTALGNKLNTSLKGAANGLAELGADGKVLSGQLPSYVDDVLEYANKTDFPATGEAGKIYVDLSNNQTYRWSGSAYIQLKGDIALGETSSTAYRGDRGKVAYDHAQMTSGNPHNVTKADIGLDNVENKSSATIRSELTKQNVTSALGYTPLETETTYTFATGDTNGTIKVTPSDGTAQSVAVKGLGNAAYMNTGTSSTTVALGNHTHANVSTTTAGFMSADDKNKLNYTNIAYGTCTTAGSTAEKEVVLNSNNSHWTLQVGSIICIKFSNDNTANNPTLNVNNTGAKNVWYNVNVLTTNDKTIAGKANRPSIYIYDGTNYVFFGWSTDRNDIPSGYCTTAAGVAAKEVQCNGYTLTEKTYLQIILSTTNTAASALTLNVNSKGTKPIYINGEPSSNSNYTLPSGSYFVYYDGTNYYFRTDGKLTANITGSASKWETARTLSVGGDTEGEVNLDGSADVSLSLKRRGASVGQITAVSENTNLWYKFAEINIDDTYSDRTIFFHVYKAYADESGKALGILKAHIRTNGNKQWESSSLMWELAGTEIFLDRFILAHTDSTTSPTKAELWCKCSASHTGYHFDVISEGNRTSRMNNLWTLFNVWSNGGEASIPEGLIQQQSTLTTIKNNIAGNAATVNGKTVESNVPANAKFTDTTYTNATTSASGLMSAEDKIKLNYANVAYGTCSTDSDVAEKEIIINENTNWSLAAGAIVAVYFTKSNYANNPTFNVNNTGAKSVFYGSSQITTSNLTRAGSKYLIQVYMYDGTYFRYLCKSTDDNATYSNGTLGQGYGICTTENGTIEKVVPMPSYKLSPGGIVAVKFSANVDANATMNINEKGAKNIFYKGARITAGVINAGDIATFIYDETQYQLISVDRWAKSITNITRDGTTFTMAYADGTIGTFTQQDSNTIYTGTDGVSISGTTISNSGVRSITSGATNGTISVNTNGTTEDVAVKGLGALAYKASLSKSDIGLGNVENKSSAMIRGELTQEDVTAALGYTPSEGNATYSVVSKNAPGLAPQLPNETTTEKYLRQDGTWVKPPNTTYTFTNGLSNSNGTVSNSGVRSIATGSSNGTISVNTNGTSADVAIKGLAGAAYKSVDTSISAASTSTNLPTAAAVASFVEGKGYKTTDNNTTYTFATGDANGQIKVTPSGGSAQNISVKGLGSLAYKSSLSASEVGALATSLRGAVNGVAELGADGKVPSSQLPSYVDDVLEYAQKSSFPETGETGKIYISQNDNKTYRWSGSAYVEISASLALGTTSSTAFRGDYGNSAYMHAVTNKGAAFTSGLYKITTNSEGHVTAATAVQKSDITALGIPESDTNTWTKVSTSEDGYVTKLPGNTTSFLRGDGTWATPNYPTSLNLKSIELVNQDLDNYKTPNFYYAGGGNTIANKPSGVNTFGMLVYKSALNNIIQELTAGNQNAKKKYIRQWTGAAWDDWTEMEYTDTWTQVSTTTDGYISKLSGSTTQWLNGNGTWSTPTTEDIGAVAKAGDTMTGALNFANNIYNKFGDDVEIGDKNKAGHLQIHGLNGATGIFLNPYSGDTAQGISIDGAGTMTITENVTIEKEVKSGTGVYKFGDSATMQYNSTDSCIDFIFA